MHEAAVGKIMKDGTDEDLVVRPARSWSQPHPNAPARAGRLRGTPSPPESGCEGRFATSTCRQKRSEHVPALQYPVQQSVSSAQAFVVAVHASVDLMHTSPTQFPVQQSESAAHVAPSSVHRVTDFAQMSLAQLPLQQSQGSEQAFPRVVH